MKFILVPPGLAGQMRALLKLTGAGELRIGGMPVLVSRHCPPDTAYVIPAVNEIPRVEESLWRREYLGSWADAEPPSKRDFVFSIDYPPAIIEYRPRPAKVRAWNWDRLHDRIHWRVWMAWFVVRHWWRQMREESHSPFED